MGFVKGIIKPRRVIAVCLAMLVASQAQAAVNINVDASPAPAAPGQRLIVEITVTNDGALPVTGIMVDMGYPADGMDGVFESAITGPFTFNCTSTACNPGETLVWNLGTINPGQAVTFFLPPDVADTAVDGSSIDWTATVSDGGGDLDTDTATVVVDDDPALSLAIDENQDPVDANGELIYTLRYGNLSAGNVTGTELEFDLPGNVSFVSATGGGAFSSGAVSWSLNTLPAGAVGQQQVVVNVNDSQSSGTLIEASALIDGTSNFQPTERHAASVAYVAPSSSTPLALNLNLNSQPALPEEKTLLEFTVTNTTAFPVFGATVALTYPPEGMDGTFESAITGPFTNNCTSTACNRGEELIWNLGTLGPGQAVSFFLPPEVDSNTASGQTIQWRARVTEDNGSLRTETETLMIDTDPALSLAIDENQDPVAADGELIYTLRYGNESPASVTGADLAFTLPDNVSFVSATGGGVLSGDGTVAWALNTVPAGQIGQRQVVVDVNASQPTGTLIEGWAVIDGTSNFLPTERRASTVAHIAPDELTPLALGVQVSSQPALPDEKTTLEFTVTNTTAFPVFGATVALTYPPEGMDGTFESAITGPFTNNCTSTACNSGEELIWELGTLAPGQAVSFYMPPEVDGNTESGRTIQWRARVTEDNGSLRTETETLMIDTSPALSLAIDESQDPVAAGGELIYTIRYGNPSPGSVTGADLSFTLPDNVSFVSATGGGLLSADNTVDWPLNTIPGGQVGQQQVVVDVNASQPSGTLIEASAVIDGTSNFLATERRASSAAFIAPSTPLALALNVSPQPALPGQEIAVDLTVTNVSGFQVFGVLATLAYPVEGMDGVFESDITGPFTNNCTSTACNSGEELVWDLGTLNAGDSISFSLPPEVSNAISNGNLIGWRATATEDNASLRRLDVTLSAGVCDGTDSDGDNICDSFDNCTAQQNVRQRDTDLDGYGNRCDPDFDNNGFVNFADLARFKQGFATDDPDTDFDGSGFVNFADLAIIKAFFAKPPGPSNIDD